MAGHKGDFSRKTTAALSDSAGYYEHYRFAVTISVV
jgi:hypothetical protein